MSRASAHRSYSGFSHDVNGNGPEIPPSSLERATGELKRAALKLANTVVGALARALR